MCWWSSYVKDVVHMVKQKPMISMRIIEWWKCPFWFLRMIQLD